MDNVLSFRGKMTAAELGNRMHEVERVIEASGAKRSGGITTATFSIEQNGAAQVMDVEVLIPLDQDISVPPGYVWKPKFCLTNAIKLRHSGNPATLQNSALELNQYISERKLVPITAAIQEPGKKLTHVPSLALGILAIVFGLLIAIIGDVLGIAGIILAIVKRKNYNIKAGLICSILGLAIGIANHLITIFLLPQIVNQLF